MRQKSPQTTINLIYSALLLTTNAIALLETFCEKHRIVLYNFDTEVMCLLSHPSDIRMFQIARKELIMTKRQHGGNFSAASDCLRLIVPVITKLGSYVDLDVPCAFGNTTETQISAQAPLLLNVQGKFLFEGCIFSIYVNTDFIAYAYDENNPKELAKDTLTTIRCIQNRIIKNYDGKLTMEKLFNSMERAEGVVQEFHCLFIDFLKSGYPQFPFGLRRFILERNYPATSNKERAILQDHFMNMACSRISGPTNFWSLYMYAKPADDSYTFGCVPTQNVYADYIKLIVASNATVHPVISKCVTFTNTQQCQTEYVKKHGKSPEPGVLADLSWTTRGKANKDQREAALLTSAIKIQGLFQQYCETKNELEPLDHRSIFSPHTK